MPKKLKQLPATTFAAPTPVSILNMIERASSDPNVNVEKMERLLALAREVRADQARIAYAAALAQMQSDLPVINQKGRIEIREKGTGTIVQSTRYAKWEDIHQALVPVLNRHGFTLTFRTPQDEQGRVKVTAVLDHKDGHREETTVGPLLIDSTGSKNNVQAFGSSLSYGKRYATTLILNMLAKGEDDDGAAAGDARLTEKQVATLERLIKDAKCPLPKVLGFAKVEKLDDIPQADYERIVGAIAIYKKTVPERVAD